MNTTRKTPYIYIEQSASALAADAAEIFSRLSREADAARGVFRVALSGGSTPRLLYGLLSSELYRDEVPWRRVQFFFGDERMVPPTHRESNYKLAKDELFNKVGAEEDNIFPIPTEGVTPEEAAAQYEATIRRAFNLKKDEVPRFDLIFLGMGDDGHTASLFPHTPTLRESKKLVAANYVEKLSAHRVTLTPPVLKAGREIVFLVTGEDKAAALREVLEGKKNIKEYPSQILREAEGRVTWLVDKYSAAQLDGSYAQDEGC